MDGPALSWRERQLLAYIEDDLREDAELEKALRTMRIGRLRWLHFGARRDRGDGRGGLRDEDENRGGA
jgi:hypothetical protein